MNFLEKKEQKFYLRGKNSYSEKFLLPSFPTLFPYKNLPILFHQSLLCLPQVPLNFLSSKLINSG